MLAGIDISHGLVGWGETYTTTPFYFDHSFSFLHICDLQNENIIWNNLFWGSKVIIIRNIKIKSIAEEILTRLFDR
ncbi:MAG: hypothetical protein WBE61_06075 [Nitrososphaeraceae archaeon]|jgi:hypothetical protein